MSNPKAKIKPRVLTNGTRNTQSALAIFQHHQSKYSGEHHLASRTIINTEKHPHIRMHAQPQWTDKNDQLLHAERAAGWCDHWHYYWVDSSRHIDD